MLNLCKKIVAGGLSGNLCLIRQRFLFFRLCGLCFFALGIFVLSAVLLVNGIFGPFAFNEKYNNDWYRSIFCWVYFPNIKIEKQFLLALTDRLDSTDYEVVICRRDKQYIIVENNNYMALSGHTNGLLDIWSKNDFHFVDYFSRFSGFHLKKNNTVIPKSPSPYGLLMPIDHRAIPAIKKILGSNYKSMLPYELTYDNTPWLGAGCVFFIVSIVNFFKSIKIFKLNRNVNEKAHFKEAISVSPPVRSHAVAGIVTAGLGILASYYFLIAPMQYAVSAVFAFSGLCLAISGLFAHVALSNGNIIICTQKSMLDIPCKKVKWLFTECCDGCSETLCIGLKHQIVRTEIPGTADGRTFYEQCIKACKNAAVGYKPSMMLSWEQDRGWSDIVRATRSELE